MNRLRIAGAMSLALVLQACNPGEEEAKAPGEPTTTASDAMKNMPMPGQAPATPGAGQTYTTTGEIAEMAGESVTINHQPVPALGWPSMTMTFKAPDMAMMAGLAKGAPVEFTFRQEGSDHVLTEIRRR
jgi:Cu/Ag efflux protein CusF